MYMCVWCVCVCVKCVCLLVCACTVSSTPANRTHATQSVFFYFFHVNKWYIFSAYSTYGFTVHFSLDLNNYKWTFSTLKNGTNVSHARYLSLSLSLFSRTRAFASLPFSLSFSRLSFFLSRTLSHVNLFCFTCVPYKRLYIWLYVLLAIKDQSFFFSSLRAFVVAVINLHTSL